MSTALNSVKPPWRPTRYDLPSVKRRFLPFLEEQYSVKSLLVKLG
jgi:hypothetical protein